MNNDEALKNLQKKYESLKYFKVNGSMLTLEYNGYFKIPLNHVNLASINPNLFYLNPLEILNAIYVLELLYYQELSVNEVNFITDFVNYYLKLKDMYIGSEKANDNLEFKVWQALHIPISKSEEAPFINSYASKIIHEIINNHNIESFSTNSRGPRLVRTNKTVENFYIPEENNNFADISKYGFSTIILIITTIFMTCLYIAFFIIGK